MPMEASVAGLWFEVGVQVFSRYSHQRAYKLLRIAWRQDAHDILSFSGADVKSLRGHLAIDVKRTLGESSRWSIRLDRHDVHGKADCRHR